MSIQVRTSAFSDHEPIPSRYAKDNEDLSPPLDWSDAPSGTVEFAITCVDPDAPSGTYIHWLVGGIDPQETSCNEGKPPLGSYEGRNSYGAIGYGGPQPPFGDDPHRYFFRVHALNQPLNLEEGFTHEDLQRALAQSEIATGVVVGTYQR